MKKMKPDTEIMYRLSPSGIKKKVGVDTRTGNVRRRWWTKARIPGPPPPVQE